MTERQALSPARKLAYDCLESARKRDAFARNVLDKALVNSKALDVDKAFASKLVLGVISTSGTLDEFLEMCMNAGSVVSPEVRTALRISAYEMLFLDKPAHVAVHQGVSLVKSFSPKASGFANAILRRASQKRKSFPFGDVNEDLKALCRSEGFPYWMAERIYKRDGFLCAKNFMEASNDDAPLFVRFNSLKGCDDDILLRLHSAQIDVEPALIGTNNIKGCYLLTNKSSLQKNELQNLISDGYILVSDAAAQLVVQCVCEALYNVGVKSTSKAPCALELCCGRGTKTILLQDSINRLLGRSFAEFISLDSIPFKTEITKKRVVQYNAKVDDVICDDILSSSLNTHPSLNGNRFDMVFLDAPCTGTGTLRRHPEIRWRLTASDIYERAKIGLSLLQASAKFVNPGGILAFSTCSAEPEEGEEVVASFLNTPEGSPFEVISVNKNASTPLLRTTLFPKETAQEAPSPDSHFLACFELRR